MDSVLRLKTAPKEIKTREIFIDQYFKGRYQMLFWPGYQSQFWDIHLDFFLKNIGWNRLGAMYPDASLFGDEDEKMVSDPI
jgi:hypothetical protein